MNLPVELVEVDEIRLVDEHVESREVLSNRTTLIAENLLTHAVMNWLEEAEHRRCLRDRVHAMQQEGVYQ